MGNNLLVMSSNSSPDQVRALIALLGDPDLTVKEQASRDLQTFGASAVPALLIALGEEPTWLGAAEALARLGVLAVEPLIDALDNPHLSNFAAHAIDRMGAPAVLPLVHALPQAPAGSEASGWIQLLLEWFSERTENLDPALRERAITALAENRQQRPSTEQRYS